MNHFLWLKKGYETIYDDLAYNPNSKKNFIYPKAGETDKKYNFGLGLDQNSDQKEDEELGIKRFLIVTSS